MPSLFPNFPNSPSLISAQCSSASPLPSPCFKPPSRLSYRNRGRVCLSFQPVQNNNNINKNSFYCFLSLCIITTTASIPEPFRSSLNCLFYFLCPHFLFISSNYVFVIIFYHPQAFSVTFMLVKTNISRERFLNGYSKLCILSFLFFFFFVSFNDYF